MAFTKRDWSVAVGALVTVAIVISVGFFVATRTNADGIYRLYALRCDGDVKGQAAPADVARFSIGVIGPDGAGPASTTCDTLSQSTF